MAVPPAVAYWTLTAPADPPTRVTVTVAVPPPSDTEYPLVLNCKLPTGGGGGGRWGRWRWRGRRRRGWRGRQVEAYSSCPMSYPAPCGRAVPSKSTAGAPADVPLSIAGLPAFRW